MVMVSVPSSQDFLRAVRAVVGDSSRVGLHEPDISEVEHAFVAQCLDSTFVSSVGPFVTRFEEEIATYTGAASAVAVSNGTSALQVALVLAGVKPGDEVLIPALSFVATANAVSHAGAHPYFVDSDPENFGLSVDATKDVLQGLKQVDGKWVNPGTGRPVTAIVPMHALGHPMHIVDLVELANDFGIPVVEDAAESLGSFVGTQHTGTFGKLGILSFNGNKTITTGGGGMILTNDEALGARAKHLTTTAKLPHQWLFAHDEVAWNFRLPNLNAAMGVAQLSRLPQFLEEKEQLLRPIVENLQRYLGFDLFQNLRGQRAITGCVRLSSTKTAENFVTNCLRLLTILAFSAARSGRFFVIYPCIATVPAVTSVSPVPFSAESFHFPVPL